MYPLRPRPYLAGNVERERNSCENGPSNTSPIDALIAVTKRLSVYESQQRTDSEAFFDQYSRGQLSDDAVFIDWANE